MCTIIGSARIDENGNATGGKRGDQKQTSVPDKSGEVSMQEFYVPDKGWYVIRPKSAQHAADIAARMADACNNINIGYSQGDRESLSKQGINTKSPANSDCSSLVRQCIAEATGKKISFFSTANEASVLGATKLFEKKFAFVSGSTILKAGDVLVTQTKGHTAIVVSTDGKIPTGGANSSGTGTPEDTSLGGGAGLTISQKDESIFAKGNSSLASYVNRTSSTNTDRTKPISCITVHIAKSTGSLEKLATMIKSSETSYNYGIDSQGEIGIFVDEAYASTGTGDKDNDDRSVNIVCANSTLSPDYKISSKCYQSLIDLCEDICRRRFIFKLEYNKKKPEQGTFTLHKQFDSKVTCPGPYLTDKLDDLIKEINTRLNTVNRQRVSVTSWQADSDSAALRAQSTVSLGAISPFIARLEHDASNVNYDGLQKMGVVGILFHGGSYYDKDHSERPHQSDIHLYGQMQEYQKSKTLMPFAIEYTSRAQSVDEAKKECKAFYYILAKYRPKLGAWVRPQFDKSMKKDIASAIIDTYYESFVNWGFKSKCGIIATMKQAELIQWPMQANYMPLWLEGSLDEKLKDTVEEVLTPSYFKLNDLTNKGFNESRDREAVDSYAQTMRAQFVGAGGDGSSVSTNPDGSPISMSGTSKPKVGVKTTIPNPISSGPHAGQNRTGIVYEFGSREYPLNNMNLWKEGWPYKALKSSKLLIDKSNGIAYMNINGVKRWGTAFTTTLGGDGACVDLHMSDGKTIPFVVLDCKRTNYAAEHSDSWGHDYGKQVTELFLSTQKKAGYGYLGGKNGTYPVAFTIVGYIKQSDL